MTQSFKTRSHVKLKSVFVKGNGRNIKRLTIQAARLSDLNVK